MICDSSTAKKKYYNLCNYVSSTLKINKLNNRSSILSKKKSCFVSEEHLFLFPHEKSINIGIFYYTPI